jgi:sugar phosphate isomerase/epimerase
MGTRRSKGDHTQNGHQKEENAMKLGVLTVMYKDRPLEAVLDHVAGMGLQAVELGAGGYPGKEHCDPDRLLPDPNAIKAIRKAVQERGLIISALSCHGNPLHPDRTVAAEYDRTFRQAVRLASEMEVPVVNLFSG